MLRPLPAAALLRLLFAAAAGLAACAPPAAPAAPAPAAAPAAAAAPDRLPQGHVYTGVVEEPDDVNPFTSHTAVARRYVLGFTHDTLLDTDPQTGAERPALAAGYELSADGREAVFTLRDGVVFADGTPLGMADVLFGYELAAAGHLQLGFCADAFAAVERAEALDARRLRLRVKQPHFAGVRALAEQWVVASKAWFLRRVAALAQAQGEAAPEVGSRRFAELLGQIDRECGPGTGPYLLPDEPSAAGGWRRRQDLRLVRNERCWRRQAHPGAWNLGGVRLLFRDPQTAPLLLRQGEIDWFSSPNADLLLQQQPELGQRYRKVVYDYGKLGVVRLVWNCRRPRLQDPQVRTALARLCDVPAVVQLYRGHAVPAVALQKPSAPDYPRELAPPPYDPAAARQQLRAAGGLGDDAAPFVVLAPADGGPLEKVLVLLHAAGAAAGVRFELRQLPFAAYIAAKGQGDWDGLLVMHPFRDSGDPYEFVHSRGADNEGGFADAEVDRLAAAVRITFDAAARRDLLLALHRRVHALQPAALLVHPLAAVLLDARLQAAVPGPLGLWPERFWMPAEHQRP